MGTWDMQVFEDDLAMDIKDSFEELIEEGETVETAIENILEEFEDCLEDFDDGVTTILALATIAIERGVITKRLKREFTRVINNNEYWNYLKEENEELYKARIKQVNSIKERIN
ncbi:DUF4259 domain-containing protein [Haloimpatiens massiliensis]|uniref:DUF4259 domain-containing protein n=1 Tax=Haloimpatiens massiliensis TaxID=1658110 RepID=UPI000C82E157|nr:DUF4259 domain-containing protein [Haloimpatiens massiliensis]